MVDSRRLQAIAALLFFCSPALVAQQYLTNDTGLTTIRKHVDEVNLTFTVTDGRGRFLTGLTQDNFAILDDRHPPANVRRFQSLTDMPLRICMVIDASDSITNYLKFQQEVALGFLKRILRPGVDQACLVKFTNRSELIQDFTDDVAKLESSIRRVTAHGSTAVWDALHFTSETMSKQETPGQFRRAIVLVSDGEDNSSYYTFEQGLQALLKAEITVEVVNTIQLSSQPPPLRRLARMTGGQLWEGSKPKHLIAALAKIEQSLRSQYFVAYQPAGALAPGQFRKIQLKAKGHRGKIAYRTGYFVPSDQ